MNRMVKKALGIVLSLIIVFLNSQSVSAELPEWISGSFNSHWAIDYEQTCDDYKYLAEKRQKDISNTTGRMSAEYEEYFNKCGVLDEEINALGADDIEFITSADKEDINICTTIRYCGANKDLYRSEYYDLRNDLFKKLFFRKRNHIVKW